MGIAGATAYTSLELIKLLLRHPETEIVYLGTRREEKPPISQIFPSLKRQIDLPTAGLEPEDIPKGVELVFVTLPPTVTMKYVPRYLKAGHRVIDFSADYRFKDAEKYEQWYKSPHTDPDGLKKAVYGLPELFRKEIRKAKLVSNPGCYPVSVILALMPFFIRDMIEPSDIIADSKSGISGGGRNVSPQSMYCERNENLEPYGVGGHRHLPEMEEIIQRAVDMKVKITFSPHLVPMDRGLLSTTYARLKSMTTTEAVTETMKNVYKDEPFIRIKEPDDPPCTKDVVGTNFCDISARVADDRVVIISAIDNLLKGASGIAVQNMNIMYGFPERLV
ncbi:MAG: N-acetyl-gamma-glutamyl-phosphate reductase [Candidatus Brocadiales bacterium]|nr:N-acetyl-gamma-glutamyl-phosphate reductase [Candidatus Bathyanammoxibius amoris]